MNMSERVSVVTGASSGIGRAVALALARDGAHVWALARNEERLASLAAESAGAAGSLDTLALDLEVEEEADAAAARVGACGVDALVHSAGVIEIGSAESLSAKTFDTQYRVNLRAPFLLTRALLPALERTQGHVVFVNSSAGIRASAANVQYAATKHALRALADGLRDELNPRGVRVTSVYLGRTATPMQEVVHEREGRTYDPELLLPPEDVAAAIVAALSLPATAEMTDVHVRPMKKLPTL